jgi:hypothetical protein
LFLIIVIPIFIASFFKKDKSDADEMAQGCGLGCLIYLGAFSFLCVLVYRLFT